MVGLGKGLIRCLKKNLEREMLKCFQEIRKDVNEDALLPNGPRCSCLVPIDVIDLSLIRL